jgi:anti-sigma B factor antagonist
MLTAELKNEHGIILRGRFDASQVDYAKSVFITVSQSCIVDMAELEYISSAGLGVLLMTQKRLSQHGAKLKLININGHIRDVFRYAGFDKIFEIG